MLVLSRKLGEKIVIGDNIVVTVVKIDRNQIRIGIEAPTDVPVYRQEIAPNRVENRNASEPVVVELRRQASRSLARRSVRRAQRRGPCPSGPRPLSDRHPAIGSAVTGPS